jgi:small-conductance mechanosensitive channel
MFDPVRLFEILKITVFGNMIVDYAVSLAVFLFLILVVLVVKRIVFSRLEGWARKTSQTFDDLLFHMLERTVVPLLYFGSLYLSTRFLTLSEAVNRAIYFVGSILLLFFGINFLIKSISIALQTYWLKRERDPAKMRSLSGIMTIVKVTIWGLGIVLLLDNLGLEISAVIAGLGIGGIAIALAAQAVLGDLFSYFAIFFDRPFEIGDFIIVGDYLGTVEHTGVKTTRLRSLGGEELIISNSDLTNSRVRNYKRMEKRRVVFKLGITYQTTSERVKEIPKIIEGIIKGVKDVAFDRAHFFSYGDFSLVYEVVYYVFSSDYNKYMDVQQEINFAIKDEFEKRKIEFAYPTQTLFVNKE